MCLLENSAATEQHIQERSAFTKKVIHVDMDCFYAAVEMRDKKELRNRPIAVGGHPGRRGVLCTCNYVARKLGIRSAMPSARAMKICPDLKIISPDFKRYKEASEIIRGIFHQFTDLVEPISLDEAYLDVTSSNRFCGSATLQARKIKELIFKETGLIASAGVAPNKFLAKVASDWKKPDGMFTISPDQVFSFVSGLDVRKIPGVGKVTEAKMCEIGLKTCLDLQKKSLNDLVRLFGKFGFSLYNFSRGIDDSKVIATHERKSLSLERTYERDIESLGECIGKLPELIDELFDRINQSRNCDNTNDNNDKTGIISKVFVKMKFDDFKTVTAEKGITDEIFTNHDDVMLFSILEGLLSTAFNRKNRAVRLLGVGVRFSKKIEGFLF